MIDNRYSRHDFEIVFTSSRLRLLMTLAMTRCFYHCCFLLACLVLGREIFAYGLSNLPPAKQQSQEGIFSRRSAIDATAKLLIASVLATSPLPAFAAADCFKDCMQNCKLIAPKDPDYCLANCKGYCEQDDRTDGLSGSVSSTSGEVGILGGTFGQGTVPKGEDRVSTLFVAPENRLLCLCVQQAN
jgi:hypothetical protein